MIAYCGLECLDCMAYKATLANDDKLREKCAQIWSKMAKIEIKPEQINCDGCKSERKLFFFCHACSVKKCASGKGIESCIVCPAYICEKLESLMKLDPNVRKSIESRHQK